MCDCRPPLRHLHSTLRQAMSFERVRARTRPRLEPLIGAEGPRNEGEILTIARAALGVLVVAGGLVLLWLVGALVAVVLLYHAESPT